MSQQVTTATKTFTAGAAIAQYLRVKLSSGKLAVAGAGVSDGWGIGTMTRASFADGDKVAVDLMNRGGTRKMVAAAAITSGAEVYGAAGGKIDDSASGNVIGRALEAATADGDVIEVLTYAVPGK